MTGAARGRILRVFRFTQNHTHARTRTGRVAMGDPVNIFLLLSTVASCEILFKKLNFKRAVR